MAVRLSSRPLPGTRRGRRLWVPPQGESEAVGRAIDLGFNTIVVGDPGVGVSTLLNQLAATLEDGGRSIARVSAGGAGTAIEMIDLVADALDGADDPQMSASARSALRRLASAANEQPSSVVSLDHPIGGVAHDVFGRMRDELWEVPLQWLVGASSDDAAVLLQPPADAFFETVRRLGPLSTDEIQDLLQRRDPDDDMGADVRRNVAEASRGNPSLALALAREALLRDPSERSQLFRIDPVADVRDRVGEPAARLFAELLRTGPASPSDPDLLRRMHWSRPRAYQVFRTLETEGLVRAHNERSGSAGRPRKVYEAVTG